MKVRERVFDGNYSTKVKGVYLKSRDADGREVWYYHVSQQGKQLHRGGGSLQAAVQRREKAQDRIERGLPPFPAEAAKPRMISAVTRDYVHVPRREVKRAETFAAHLGRLMPETVDRISEFTLRKHRDTRKREGVGAWRTLSQVQRYSKADKDRIRQTMAALSRNLNRPADAPARIATVLLEVSAS